MQVRVSRARHKTAAAHLGAHGAGPAGPRAKAPPRESTGPKVEAAEGSTCGRNRTGLPRR